MTNQPGQVIRKVFICNNGKCASTETATEIFDVLTAKIRENGLDAYDAPLRIKCLISGCLDVCENGPVMVIHPGATYYWGVDRNALENIFETHLVGGTVVKDYVHRHKTQRNDE